MAEFKCGMIPGGITYLTTDTLPVVVIQSAFSLPSWGRYLVPLCMDTNLWIVAESSFLLLYQGMYLLSDME